MSRSVQLNLPPALVSSIDKTESTSCPDQVNAVDGLAELLRVSQEAVQIQHKEAAISAGYTETYWTRVLDNERGVYLDRLAKLPEPVQREFVKRWGRMLRMDIRDEDTRKRAIAEAARAVVNLLSEIA